MSAENTSDLSALPWSSTPCPLSSTVSFVPLSPASHHLVISGVKILRLNSNIFKTTILIHAGMCWGETNMDVLSCLLPFSGKCFLDTAVQPLRRTQREAGALISREKHFVDTLLL